MTLHDFKSWKTLDTAARADGVDLKLYNMHSRFSGISFEEAVRDAEKGLKVRPKASSLTIYATSLILALSGGMHQNPLAVLNYASTRPLSSEELFVQSNRAKYLAGRLKRYD